MDEHSTYMGSRSVRDAQGRYGAMPFARCYCGWEGPGRLSRRDAVNDGFGHLEANALPESDPDDAEAQRIAEVFADARAEQDRGL